MRAATVHLISSVACSADKVMLLGNMRVMAFWFRYVQWWECLNWFHEQGIYEGALGMASAKYSKVPGQTCVSPPALRLRELTPSAHGRMNGWKLWRGSKTTFKR